MADPQTAPYGSWKSPITSDLIIGETVGLSGPLLDGADTYWLESRPGEGGRTVLVRQSAADPPTDLTPAPFNVRTRVHEYGGGAYVVHESTVYFVNFADQQLYRLAQGGAPAPLTPPAALRYADGVIDAQRGRMICVREDHTDAVAGPVNTLVSLDLAGGDTGQVLTSGNDFYAAPRLSPDGAHLAWLTWNHPNMPWDGTELWVAEIQSDGTLGHAVRVAGGLIESIFQPEWSPTGVLHFISDRTGWWNLYRWQAGQVEPLCPMEAEFGEPQWGFRMSTYAFLAPQRIICTYGQHGTYHLAILDTDTQQLTPLAVPYTDISNLQAGPDRVVFLAGAPALAPALVQFDPATQAITVLRQADTISVDPGYLSIPQEIAFPTEQGLTAHAFFYPPRNQDYTAPTGERPPLVVMSHGGPTSATSSTLSLGIQYWTSRGLAVLDVNYGGSTGYGRAYRERLNGQWGVVDVDDCVNGARYLVAQGLADGARLAIRGGSAGGYTTLAALTFRNVFHAGASYFGISDLAADALDTHKFESRYSDRLVGPYPERSDLYYARSPIHFVDRISCPVILFQGLDDPIVTPRQAEVMVSALRAKGLPVAYLPFAGESHGFRQAANLKRSREAELYFYARIFGFPLADPIEPVEIENL